MGRWSKALATLPKDSGKNPSTNMALKLSVTLVPQDTMPSSGPPWARGIHAGKTPTHIKLKEKENPEQSIEKTWHVLQ